MGRAILSVIAGFIVMAVFVGVTLSIAASVLGVDKVYKPGSYEPATTWVAVDFVLALAGAILGGAVCGLIARRHKPVFALCAVVLVMGALSVALTMGASKEPLPARAGNTVDQKAAMRAKPAWISIAEPLLGVAGVLLGGGIACRKAQARSAPVAAPPSQSV